MAKLADKFFNRFIEGPLDLEAHEKAQIDTEAQSEIAKVIPSPSGQGGKVLGVNAGGTAYELKDPSSVNSVDFENIYDSDGHKRFISFNGTPSSNEGVHSVFCKATLSGSHLMFVFAGTIDDTTEISNGHSMAIFDLPDWIMNKIYPVWSSQYIESKSVPAYNDDWTSQSLEIVLQKVAYGIQFTNVGSFVADKERNFRIAFDLVID